MARARYVLLLFLVTQISQMTQIFLRGRVWSHRFHRYTQIFYGISGESLCPILRGYLQRPNRSPLRNSVSNRRSKNSPNKSHVILWKKSASSAKSAWLKKRPKKNLCISVKSVGHFPISGGIFSSWDYFCPTDFTDIHRFFMESLVNRFIRSQGVSETTEQVASAKFRE